MEARHSGFYELSSLNTKTLRALFKDVFWDSHFISCESKYTETNKFRGRDTKYSIRDFLRKVDTKNHNVFIDRSIQHESERNGEVGFMLAPKYDSDWHQITFLITLDRLHAIREKYGLVELV